MTDTRKRKLDRVDFLGDCVLAFKNSVHTDVIVKSAGDGPGIPAHKTILAAKSKVFSYMLDSDECKTSVEKSITIPDLSYEELKALLEFFYSGILSPTNKHIRALYVAADKYDIPYLQELCRDHFKSTTTLSNVLDILEMSTIHSDNLLKDWATFFVLTHMEEIVNSSGYRLFVQQNPDQGLYITQAFVKSLKSQLGSKLNQLLRVAFLSKPQV
ncbi:unnamed protein product [Eruca vesicaria subsp. sativa]|uniref:BTB domain-containing protein n=1 Tax=Eruca vesicaria subsp. sativa TaxID=29727 RepID=A0ABC8LVA3_ERUVS|nr:unnamed protein product [Eruca vesicaria subsp. sativa]